MRVSYIRRMGGLWYIESQFFNTQFFRAVVGSQQNWAEYTEISPILCPHIFIVSPIINIFHHSGTCVPGGESALTHHYHPKCTAYIRVHCWCCAFCGFKQIYDDTSPLFGIFSFFVKILSVLPIHNPLSPSTQHQPLANTDIFPVSIALPFLECHIVGII